MRTTSAACGSVALRNVGSSQGPASATSTPSVPMNAMVSTMMALPTRRAHSGSPAPIDWPTSVVPASAMPMPGMYDIEVSIITICVAAPSAALRRTCISWNSAMPNRSAAYITPIGRPSRYCRARLPRSGRQVRCDLYCRRTGGRRNIHVANASPHTMLTFVAQAEPAMPPSSTKMNSQLSTAFTTATISVVASATRGREMPLKKPVMAQSATPIGAPSMRGCQKAIACYDTSGASPNGAKIHGPSHASTA